jgi:ankyrin repeat protein
MGRQDGSASLFFAAESGSVEVARLLLEHKAELNASNQVLTWCCGSRA